MIPLFVVPLDQTNPQYCVYSYWLWTRWTGSTVGNQSIKSKKSPKKTRAIFHQISFLYMYNSYHTPLRVPYTRDTLASNLAQAGLVQRPFYHAFYSHTRGTLLLAHLLGSIQPRWLTTTTSDQRVSVESASVVVVGTGHFCKLSCSMRDFWCEKHEFTPEINIDPHEPLGCKSNTRTGL